MSNILAEQSETQHASLTRLRAEAVKPQRVPPDLQVGNTRAHSVFTTSSSLFGARQSSLSNSDSQRTQDTTSTTTIALRYNQLLIQERLQHQRLQKLQGEILNLTRRIEYLHKQYERAPSELLSDQLAVTLAKLKKVRESLSVEQKKTQRLYGKESLKISARCDIEKRLYNAIRRTQELLSANHAEFSSENNVKLLPSPKPSSTVAEELSRQLQWMRKLLPKPTPTTPENTPSAAFAPADAPPVPNNYLIPRP